MLIDVVFLLLLLMAFVKGLRKGFIIAVFSLVGFILGLAVAVKLSAVAAGYIGRAVNVSERWLPLIAFIAVFIAVVILVNWVRGPWRVRWNWRCWVRLTGC